MRCAWCGHDREDHDGMWDVFHDPADLITWCFGGRDPLCLCRSVIGVMPIPRSEERQ